MTRQRLLAASAFLRDPVFLVATGLYATNRWLLVPLLPRAPEFFRSHFNDVLLIPAALPVLLAIYTALGLRQGTAPATWRENLAHLALWSLILEWAGPRWLRMGTADPWDVVAYLAGALIAGAIWHRQSSNNLRGLNPQGLIR